MWVHLGFTYAKYAICGATQNDLNPVTTVVTEATCPDCLDEHKTAEKVHAGLHKSGRTWPTYESH